MRGKIERIYFDFSSKAAFAPANDHVSMKVNGSAAVELMRLRECGLECSAVFTRLDVAVQSGSVIQLL